MIALKALGFITLCCVTVIAALVVIGICVLVAEKILTAIFDWFDSL